ncbi:U6 snRNA-specific terminal uridylyltransferase 1 [Danaus plexippus plexippus]|uniref:U6 snRNA-specific terminal uridylyltransferase 1 n=1 Tax=Danaus plexippus plexippus TaxID=278856 RepID=A0A212FKI0_DANPL|nr:U6 snRNA-specific terminal uridylyltransferase 1 [Danaus plexippus plexippus]
MEAQDILDTSKLTFEGDFEQQVEEILLHVRLTKEEVLRLQTLFDDVYNALNKVWDGIKVHAFGSIVTGLGIKVSDLDCYVELPSWLSPPEKSFVFKAKNIFKQEPWKFQQLLAISYAKVPILKFYHTPTQCNCDLSFSNPTGIQNSKLISYFLNLDVRVLKLAVLIKYWSKIHDLTGTNLMPSYCLTLMLIFYLQQIGLVPPVITLQQNSAELLINNWNLAFNELEHQISTDQTLFQLLEGFFKFYHTFKFDKYVISLYLGCAIERELFVDVKTVPLEFSFYHRNISQNLCQQLRLDTAMCVQDPFEQSRNCAVRVHPKLFQHVMNKFRNAVSDFDNNHEKAVLKKLLFRTIDNPPPVSRDGHRVRLKGVQKRFNNNKNKFQLNQRNKQNVQHLKSQLQKKQQTQT